MNELLDRDLELTTGVSHGDLGIGNLLRLSSGDLAVIDWEHAGHRLLSHDVLKLLLSVDIPPHAWGGMHPALPAGNPPHADPPEQLAIAAMLFLAGWRNRTVRAVRRGSARANRRRTHVFIRALDVLLAAAR